jgi:hypothetical protein
VTDRDPQPLRYDPARARELIGGYEIDAMTVIIGTDGSRLRLEVHPTSLDWRLALQLIPSSTKNAVAAARSSTTTPTWSIR